MFCSKCGAQVNEGSSFCSACGNPLGAAVTTATPAPQTDRIITIKREGIFGTDPMNVMIDGGEYAILRSGETKSFPIPTGMHRLQVKASSHVLTREGVKVGQGNKNDSSSDVIYIKETDGNLSFKVKMNMFGRISLVQE